MDHQLRGIYHSHIVSKLKRWAEAKGGGAEQQTIGKFHISTRIRFVIDGHFLNFLEKSHYFCQIKIKRIVRFPKCHVTILPYQNMKILREFFSVCSFRPVLCCILQLPVQRGVLKPVQYCIKQVPAQRGVIRPKKCCILQVPVQAYNAYNEF